MPALGSSNDGGGIEVEDVFRQLVGVLGFDAKGANTDSGKSRSLKVTTTLGIAADRGGEHMPVIGIRQVQARHVNKHHGR